MDLTFQVPVQYCSLQHRTLLLSPVTSTTGYCFCFGSIPSYFLELFLHWSPVAYWAPTDLGSSSFSILSFCLFILFMGFSRQEYWSGQTGDGKSEHQHSRPILWPPHAKSWLIGKDFAAWKDWGQEEKGTTEDEIAGWHHWLDGRESEWTPGVGDGQEGLACCDSWGLKESDSTEWLNWTKLNLPWFMFLTFQVPMQYCSLQHLTLLLPPVTSTTGYCFCFGSIPSFFLELFLHWFAVAYWTF